MISNPDKDYWQVVKWILKYLRGISKLCLCFKKGDPTLGGYTDTYMTGDIDSKKFTSGYMMTLQGGGVLAIKVKNAWMKK